MKSVFSVSCEGAQSGCAPLRLRVQVGEFCHLHPAKSMIYSFFEELVGLEQDPVITCPTQISDRIRSPMTKPFQARAKGDPSADDNLWPKRKPVPLATST